MSADRTAEADGTHSRDTVYALLHSAPSAATVDDPDDAMSVDSRTASRLRRDRVSEAQFARVPFPPSLHGRNSKMYTRNSVTTSPSGL